LAVAAIVLSTPAAATNAREAMALCDKRGPDCNMRVEKSGDVVLCVKNSGGLECVSCPQKGQCNTTTVESRRVPGDQREPGNCPSASRVLNASAQCDRKCGYRCPRRLTSIATIFRASVHRMWCCRSKRLRTTITGPDGRDVRSGVLDRCPPMEACENVSDWQAVSRYARS
jgi:hypothetical protein